MPLLIPVPNPVGKRRVLELVAADVDPGQDVLVRDKGERVLRRAFVDGLFESQRFRQRVAGLLGIDVPGTVRYHFKNRLVGWQHFRPLLFEVFAIEDVLPGISERSFGAFNGID